MRLFCFTRRNKINNFLVARNQHHVSFDFYINLPSVIWTLLLRSLQYVNSHLKETCIYIIVCSCGLLSYYIVTNACVFVLYPVLYDWKEISIYKDMRFSLLKFNLNQIIEQL